MAKVLDLDLEAFDRWLAQRPPHIRELAARLPPDRLYLYKPTGQRVTLVSYSENGTVTCSFSGRWNRIDFERDVFGIKPEELEECEPPPEGEQLGAILTDPIQIRQVIEEEASQMGLRGPKPRVQ